jgi:DNA-binding SARP family transcriptional activator
LLGQALGIYRGDFLSDVYSDWCLERRQQLHRLHVELLSNLAEIKYEKRSFDQAAELYRVGLEQEPYREDLLQEIMRSMHHAGQHSDAIFLFNQFSERMRKDGIPGPNQETRSLMETIRKDASVGN